METTLFLISPNAEQKNATIYDVTEGNCFECLSMLKKSDVFQFGPLFQLHWSSQSSRANGELLYDYVCRMYVSVLKEIIQCEDLLRMLQSDNYHCEACLIIGKLLVHGLQCINGYQHGHLKCSMPCSSHWPIHACTAIRN